jgi:hypothetical protein
MEMTMRKPRDFDAELKALGDKARDDGRPVFALERRGPVEVERQLANKKTLSPFQNGRMCT